MKLLKTIPAFVCFSILCFTSACKKEKNAPAPSTNYGAVQQFSVYPFGIGNEWEYAIEVIYCEGTDTTTDQYTKKYRHLSDTSIQGFVCHKVIIENYNQGGTLTNSNYVYYANKADGLYTMGAISPGGGYMFFRQSRYHELLQKHIMPELEVSSVDSIFMPDSALHLTQLPIVYNQSWRSYEYGLQFNTLRKWLIPQNIHVPAGSYYCDRLQVILPNSSGSNDFKVYQYYSYRGLTKVETSQDSLIYGNGMTGFMRTKAELVSVNF